MGSIIKGIKVSIVVPVYKAQATIKQCIESILGQTYKNIELILIDDGSPDKSGYICDQYKVDPRVIVIHDKNHGVSHARNIGLHKAAGDYVTFCDSDDYYSNDHIEQLINVAVIKRSDITISGYYVENSDQFTSSVCSQSSGYISQYDVVNHFTLDNEFGGFCWNKLYKRDILSGVEFPEDIDILEDTYFLCLAMKKAKAMYYIAEPSYYYCDNPSSAVRNIDNLYTKNNTVKYVDSWNKILKNIQFDKSIRELINIAMFEISVTFKADILKNHRINKKVALKSLNYNILKFKTTFLHCRDISLKHKIKIILKLRILSIAEHTLY